MKKIVCGVMALMMAFAMTGCANNDELQKEIAALHAQIERQEDKITELENQNGALSDKLIKLENEVYNLSDKLIKLENEGYKEYNYNNILKQFDLTEEKIILDSSFVESDFATDIIIVVFKKTYTYPEIDIKYFGLEKAKEIKYIFFKPTEENLYNAEYKEKFRQIAYIYLEECTKEEVVEMIRHLEMLEFIKAVTPNYKYVPEDDGGVNICRRQTFQTLNEQKIAFTLQ